MVRCYNFVALNVIFTMSKNWEVYDVKRLIVEYKKTRSMATEPSCLWQERPAGESNEAWKHDVTIGL